MKKFALLIAVVCLCVCGASAQGKTKCSPGCSAVTGLCICTQDMASEGSPMPVCQPGHNCGEQLTPVEGVQVGPNIVCVDHIRKGVVLSHYCSHNLKTTYGIDQIATYIGSTGNVGFGYGYIDISTDSGSPAAGDCTTSNCPLTGIISTNGLAPALATYAHTTGTATYTLTHTWTATGTVTNAQKAAVSLQSLVSCSGLCGFMFENTFSSVTLATNDQLQITWTITIS